MVKPLPVNMLDDVRAFHKQFQLLHSISPRHLTRRKLQERVEFLQEELDEFKLACDQQDLAAQADALIDLVYVALGTACMLGLPWYQLWADVHRANMAKVRGQTARGHQVDVTKPPGWLAPQPLLILMQHGYQRSQWTAADGLHVVEALCVDNHQPKGGDL